MFFRLEYCGKNIVERTLRKQHWGDNIVETTLRKQHWGNNTEETTLWKQHDENNTMKTTRWKQHCGNNIVDRPQTVGNFLTNSVASLAEMLLVRLGKCADTFRAFFFDLTSSTGTLIGHEPHKTYNTQITSRQATILRLIGIKLKFGSDLHHALITSEFTNLPQNF